MHVRCSQTALKLAWLQVFEGWAEAVGRGAPHGLTGESSLAASSSTHWLSEDPRREPSDSESEPDQDAASSISSDFESAASSASTSSCSPEDTHALLRAADSLNLEVKAAVSQDGPDSTQGAASRSPVLEQPDENGAAAAAQEQNIQWWRRLLRRTESGS